MGVKVRRARSSRGSTWSRKLDRLRRLYDAEERRLDCRNMKDLAGAVWISFHSWGCQRIPALGAENRIPGEHLRSSNLRWVVDRETSTLRRRCKRSCQSFNDHSLSQYPRWVMRLGTGVG